MGNINKFKGGILMSDCRILRNAPWSDSSLRLFRLVRYELREKGYINASLSMLLCVILKNTSIMNDYILRNHVSKEDFNNVIQNRCILDCYKINANKKVKPVYKGKGSLHSSFSSYMNYVFDLQHLIIQESDNKQISFFATSDLIDILLQTVMHSKKDGIDVIEPEHILSTMFNSDRPELCELLNDLHIDYDQTKQFFLNLDAIKIPDDLSDILSIFSDTIDISKPCEILNRDSECQLAWNIMLKRDRHNVVIIGESGYGKTAMVEKLTDDIVRGDAPKHFSSFKVISLDVYALMKKVEYAQNVVNFLKDKKDIIIFIDNIIELFFLQMEGQFDIISVLNSLWFSKNVIVIATLNRYDYNEVFLQYDIANHFEYVQLLPVYPKDMYSMFKLKIQSLSEYHGISITPEIAEFAIKICFALNNTEFSFYCILNIIDASMATAKRMGFSSVNKEAILENCQLSYHPIDNISDNEQMKVNIHEASHYVVMSECKKTINHVGVCIVTIPYGINKGLTYSVPDTLNPQTCDLDYYLDYIAYYLAGKAGENIYGYDNNSGSSNDLSKATQIAFEAINDLDLLGFSFRNSLYINSTYSLEMQKELSEQMNTKAEELLDKGFERAKSITRNNKDVISAIANALLTQPVMISDDIDKIIDEVKSKRPKENQCD